MGYLFLLLWLVSPAVLVAGLVRPTIFRGLVKNIPTRSQILLSFILSFFTLFVLAGTTLPRVEYKANSKPEQKETSLPQVKVTHIPTGTIASEAARLYTVTRVVDGDTIKVDLNGKYETVRLIGIDTPETVEPRQSVQCFGEEATHKLSELLSKKKVILEGDHTQGDRDKYNRLLRYVFLDDRTLTNKTLIEQGYAYEYTYDTPYKYQKDFKDAQENAIRNKKGLWAENACVTSSPPPSPTNTAIIP